MTGAERTAVALMISCGFCWATPGTACSGRGQHLARYLRAYRRGLLARDELTVICADVSRVSAGLVVPEVAARPAHLASLTSQCGVPGSVASRGSGFAG
jgi:hypothetical protein